MAKRPDDRPRQSAGPAPSGTKDIWQQVLEKKREDEEKDADKKAREASIIFLGPRQSGKSTLINAYVAADKKDEVPPPTSSLDYKSVRSHVGMDEKSLTHFWEVGGGRTLVNLVDIAITPDSLPHSLVVIVLDLSKPTRVVSDAQYWLGVVRQHATKFERAQPAAYAKLMAEATKRFGEGHKDLPQLQLLPVPVLLLGGKFDEFKENRDPELLKTMARTLRMLAHINGASLLYFSKKSANLVQAFRSRMDRHVLNKVPSKSVVLVDHMKPLSVQAGTDELAQIGDPSGRTASANAQLQSWINLCQRYFPASSDEDKEEPAPKDLRLAPEPLLDHILAEKEEDLKRLQKDKESKRQAMRGAGAEFKEVKQTRTATAYS